MHSNKTFHSLKVNTFLVFALTLFTACQSGDGDSSSSSQTSSSTLTESTNYALLGPISDANVTVLQIDKKTVVATTQTKAFSNETTVSWPANTVGSFKVDINDSISDDTLLLVTIQNGEDIDADDDGNVDNTFTPLQGTIKAYAYAKDFRLSSVRVNALTTLATQSISATDTTQEIRDKLDTYAKKVFRLSINDDEIIDYKDLISFTPNLTKNTDFINPAFYEQLHTSGLIRAMLDDQNITALLNSDSDGDMLTLEEELFVGSDSTLSDTDNDGINDYDEVQSGLNPNNSDSDFDGLDDYNESINTTDPLLSDTDGDYWSDSYEIAQGSDPLNPDEDANGVLDGLDGDPLFKYQWHLQSNGDVVSNTNNIATVPGNDLDILKVYAYQRGNTETTLIQVVDTGVELAHEDLLVDTKYSHNAVNGSNDPTPTQTVSSYDPLSPFEIGHGTAVAGIIGAIANNGLGVRGIVPNATIAGSNWLENQSILELDDLWYSNINANDILITNNSWGTYFSKDTEFEDIMALASQELRDGKGRLFVFAAGNDRDNFGNSNLSYITNNRYAIAVAALTYENKFSPYSNPGSNILVSAYGGDYSYQYAPTIATTLLTGKSYYESELGSTLGAITFDDDTTKSYTYAMNGTSSAAPMVTGALALVLESCPNLTWRDVRWLLSYTSKKIDPLDDKWVTNTAGREHSINYGFGLIDADNMIQECRSPYYTLLPQELSTSVKKESINLAIPDNNQTQYIQIDVDTNFIVEWVELTVDTNHPYAGDLAIELYSPGNTKSELITPNELRSNYYEGGFRFSSAAYMGEESQGTWKIGITDRLKLDSGTLNNLELTLYGHTGVK